MLISAEFDARKGDPLGGLNWKDATFAKLIQRLVALADQHASGRIVSVLEGGYIRLNRIAGDDNEFQLLAIAAKPLTLPPFPVEIAE